MNWKLNVSIAVAAAALMALPACGSSDEPANNAPANNANNANNGGKDDTPTDKGLTSSELCEARQKDVLEAGRPNFLPTALRWQCGDVEGVDTNNRDDRGQEYCEYFAITRVPSADGGYEADPVILGRQGGDLGLTLDDDQLFTLEDLSDEVVGECVFTSWHQDVLVPLTCEADDSCEEVVGIKPNGDDFRMQISINSNNAASDLVQQCIRVTASGAYEMGDLEDPENPYNDHFYRGCFVTEGLFGTHWRRSDPAVCAASMRLAECGCTVGGDPSIDVGFALVPSIREQESREGLYLRGFPLGTWSGANELPTGCRYLDIGLEARDNASQTLVACEMRGSDLIQNLQDPKEFCRQKYGDDVVVHVPIPGEAIQCEPGDHMHAGSCTDQPWVVTE